MLRLPRPLQQKAFGKYSRKETAESEVHMQETLSRTYTPSPFEELKDYIRLNNQFYEVVGTPKATASLTNIMAVSLLGALTLGTTFSLTAKGWWQSRSCLIVPLNIVQKFSSHWADSFTHQAVHPPINIESQLKTHRGWQIQAKHCSDTRLIDSLVTRFFDLLWHYPSNHLSQIWQNLCKEDDIQQMLQEQMALDALRLKKNPQQRPSLIERLKLICKGHRLHIESSYTAASSKSISQYIEKHPLQEGHALILTGQCGHILDHHLLCLFSYQNHHYLFNPYEGIFELYPTNGQDLGHLFEAYARVQFQEAPCQSFTFLDVKKA
jgi:hypothetical protein